MELTIAYYGRRLQDDESMLPPRNTSFKLKDSKENAYSEFDAPEMLDKLLEEGLIELPESKRPEELKELMIPNIAGITGSSVIQSKSVGRSRNESCNSKRKERSH